jgi:hypothetical protein
MQIFTKGWKLYVVVKFLFALYNALRYVGLRGQQSIKGA